MTTASNSRIDRKQNTPNASWARLLLSSENDSTSRTVYKATICVTLRPSILDPQGKATKHALDNLGFDGVQQVRVGKYIEMSIDVEDEGSARQIAQEACAKLLANPVMEDYTIEISAA